MAMGEAGIVGGGRRLTRLRTLGRGASGAVVALFAAEEEGELVAVKSAGGGAGAARLKREGEVMARLRSPYVLRCLGSRGGGGIGGGGHELFLEFAPGGSLADEAARNGGRLEERDVRRYAADVASGLAYLHGAAAAVVHGDVKGRNVVVGADGRAKLADFGCARRVGDEAGPVIGGTPAFMAPEVARGEEQGTAADVWALGCTVVEMATGRAPWSGVVDDAVAAVRLIGYTDAVPEAPEWLSPEAKDFLEKCFRRRACDRWTAAQLLEHPFLALAACSAKAEETKAKWVSPKSTLDAAMWESDTDDEDDDESPASTSTEERIRALAGPCSALPDWESDDGSWIEVCRNQPPLSTVAAAATPAEQTQCEIPTSPVAEPAAESTHDGVFRDDALQELDAIVSAADADGSSDEFAPRAEVADAFVDQQQQDDLSSNFSLNPNVPDPDISYEEQTAKHLSMLKSPRLISSSSSARSCTTLKLL